HPCGAPLPPLEQLPAGGDPRRLRRRPDHRPPRRPARVLVDRRRLWYYFGNTMPATTIKLPAELKERIASLIQGTGKSMHAFLLEAIEQQAQMAERRQRFVADALAARTESLRSGKGYTAAQVHAYARARSQGKTSARPKARSWRG